MWNVCACTGEATSLTLHKYVEEFPGLIHFIYVDRTTGRFLAPDMADCVDMLSQDTVSNTYSLIILLNSWLTTTDPDELRLCAGTFFVRKMLHAAIQKVDHQPQVAHASLAEPMGQKPMCLGSDNTKGRAGGIVK